MATNTFCINCGNPLGDNDRFCGRCGSPVQGETSAGVSAASQPQFAPPPPPAQRPAPAVPEAPAPTMSPFGNLEPILGTVATVQRRHGFLGLKVDSYIIAVTPERLVFTYLSKQTMSDAVKQANAEAKAQGKGFFGVIGAQFRWMEIITRALQEMSVDAIFRTYPGSFQINNNEVRRLRFHVVGDDDEGQTQQKLLIETVQGKVDYYLMGVSMRDASSVLAQTLAAALH